MGSPKKSLRILNHQREKNSWNKRKWIISKYFFTFIIINSLKPLIIYGLSFLQDLSKEKKDQYNPEKRDNESL